MARNRSEKVKPVLEGYEQWLMEPIRLDALHQDDLDGLASGGDTVYLGWDSAQRRAYDDVDEDDKKECYDKWLAYYARNPNKRVPL